MGKKVDDMIRSNQLLELTAARLGSRLKDEL
jgi:hypothetical protein